MTAKKITTLASLAGLSLLSILTATAWAGTPSYEPDRTYVIDSQSVVIYDQRAYWDSFGRTRPAAPAPAPAAIEPNYLPVQGYSRLPPISGATAAPATAGMGAAAVKAPASGLPPLSDAAPTTAPERLPMERPAATRKMVQAPAAQRNTEVGPAPRSAPQPASSAKTRRYKDGIYLINPDYALSFPRAAWHFVTAPTRFERNDWIATAAIVGVAGILLGLDEEIRDFWQDSVRSSSLDDTLDPIKPGGEYLHALYGSMGAYALAELIDQTGMMNTKRGKAAALMTAESSILAISLTQGLKYVVGRARPATSNSALEFDGPSGFNSGKRSFPSGHATVAFSVASTLSHVYGDDYPWVSWISYAGASAVAMQRINANDHWASDVLVGGLIGYFVGKTVVEVNPFLEEHNLSLGPLVTSEAQGAALKYHF